MTKVHAEFEGCAGLTVTQVAGLARELYRDAKPGIKYKQDTVHISVHFISWSITYRVARPCPTSDAVPGCSYC